MTADLERCDVVAGQVPLPGMPEEGVLFAVDMPVAEPEKLSADRRRTLRQRADVDRGVHPLLGGKTRPDLGTCGACEHRVKNHHGFPKCDVGPWTFSASTDVRAWWPACERYQPKGQPCP